MRLVSNIQQTHANINKHFKAEKVMLWYFVLVLYDGLLLNKQVPLK